MKGIIFDFNGTLFWDSYLHEQAWSLMAEKYTGKPLSHEDMVVNMHGRTNDKILAWMLGRTPSDAETTRLANEKESLYRDMCHKPGFRPKLAPGAVNLLNQLVLHNIPRAIATSSTVDNVAFYLEIFDLYQWFPKQCVVYDTHLYPGKPAPDIYLHAARAIHLPASDCVVVEDSVPGIESALAAKMGKVMVINESDRFDYIQGLRGNIQTIQTFDEVDLEREGLV